MSSKSKVKGNRGEAEIVKILQTWWNDKSFKRNVESGAIATLLEQRGAPEDVIGRLSGDILVPENFPLCCEIKTYAEVDLYSIIRNPSNNDIAQWWRQCKGDAKRAKKLPILIFKEDRKQRYAIFPSIEFAGLFDNEFVWDNGWIETSVGDEIIIMVLFEDFIDKFSKEELIKRVKPYE